MNWGAVNVASVTRAPAASTDARVTRFRGSPVLLILPRPEGAIEKTRTRHRHARTWRASHECRILDCVSARPQLHDSLPTESPMPHHSADESPCPPVAAAPGQVRDVTTDAGGRSGEQPTPVAKLDSRHEARIAAMSAWLEGRCRLRAYELTGQRVATCDIRGLLLAAFPHPDQRPRDGTASADILAGLPALARIVDGLQARGMQGRAAADVLRWPLNAFVLTAQRLRLTRQTASAIWRRSDGETRVDDFLAAWDAEVDRSGA